jgi:hypothetical protein
LIFFESPKTKTANHKQRANIMKYNISELIVEIESLASNGGVPILVQGPAGAGKSAAVKTVCERLGIGFIDLRLLTLDPVDLRGLPDKSNGKTRWLTPSFWPTQGRGIIAVEEYNLAPVSMQGPMFQLALDRRLGEYQLPDGWNVVFLGNRLCDKSAVQRTLSPLISRCQVIEVETDADSWLRWAERNNINVLIEAYIRFSPSSLNTFDGAKWIADTPYACERAWVNLSRYLDSNPNAIESVKRMASFIGLDAATQFAAFAKHASDCPSYADIVSSPNGAKVPDNVSSRYALSTSLPRATKPNDIGNVLTYLARLGREFEVIAARAMGKREELASNERLASWFIDNKNMA